MKNITALNEVIYPELEPGVISHDMIKESYRQGYKGESGRLKDLEKINYDKITVMRLEFKNILRIDHVWVLPNLTKLSLNFNKLEKIENIEMLVHLKELDLSFNYIEKIENLETLKNLETLSLFNNLITRIENLDTLENLVILSIGNNKIETVQGLERFRFFNNLKVLNLEGNPIANDDSLPLKTYIASLLPNLKYYHYVCIKEDEKEEGKNRFVRELREISNNEEDEVLFRIKDAKDLEERTHLANSFIEHLRGQILFEHFWHSNPETNFLPKINVEIDMLIDKYQDNVQNLVQEMFRFGLKKFEERKENLALFEKCTNKGLEKCTREGQVLVEAFLESKEVTAQVAKKLYTKIETLQTQGFEGSCAELNEPNAEIDRLNEEFQQEIDKLWEILIKQEVHMFQSMEEILKKLERTIKTMIDNFVKEMKIYYNDVRDLQKSFSESLKIAINKHLETNQLPEELNESFTDGVDSFITKLNNKQLLKLNETEDNLINASGKWVIDLMESKKNDESLRNRNKLVEITYFLDKMRETFYLLSTEIQDEMLSPA